MSQIHTCKVTERSQDSGFKIKNTSALTPNGGLINGVGTLSQGKILKPDNFAPWLRVSYQTLKHPLPFS